PFFLCNASKLYSQVKKPSQALTGAIQQGLQNAVTDNLPGHSTKQNPAKAAGSYSIYAPCT
ncbi:MAG: hypothetical protein PUE42_01195, partial [Subdoligranulum sp.]|nr:hypothetical protein [Subdoligranulum sp.]